MTRVKAPFGLTPREHRVSTLPSMIGSILILAIIMFNGTVVLPQTPARENVLLAFGFLGIAYLFILNRVIIPHPRYGSHFGWPNALLTAVGLAIVYYAVPDDLNPYVSGLLLLAVITSSMITGRGPSYFLILATTAAYFLLHPHLIGNLQQWTLELTVVTMAIIVLETVQLLKGLSRGHIRRLETIADFSRHIGSTLDTRQVMALLSAAFRNAIEADTYFVGVREGDQLRLELCFDDGEYYENQKVKLEGSLSSWVFENQASLFLPDLRKEVDLPGTRLVLVGKHKTSLSWLGVPMRGSHVDGIISIGSYRPNAFDRADLELLNSLAQRAAQALDNTYAHEEVERRSNLDSLTNLYNHGHFLRLLSRHLADAVQGSGPVSLIMLDVDNFKQYNDTYGHLVGDSVLLALSSAMRQHVKGSDAVGRWGGEEFAISLPGANGEQALQVALRIQGTMAGLTVEDATGISIPAPTVSQGIAVFPREASDVVALIHLADKRLYVAKDRGRNQVEPAGEPQPRTSADPLTTVL